MQRSVLLFVALLLSADLTLSGQLASRTGNDPTQAVVTPHRTRLILKDGSYQVVMSYKVVGSRVQFVSAERGGDTEEIPLELVDLDATKRFEQRHAQGLDTASSGAAQHPEVLDPELAREEAERATLTPEVAPNLRLNPQDNILALDTFHGGPELVPLMQTEGDLNRQTGHSILRGVINPNSATHQVVQIKGERSAVQMHVADPVFFIHVDEADVPASDTLTVDTHGASSSQALKQKSSGPSRYAIVRVDVRQDARILGSFDLTAAGDGKRRSDLVATTTTSLPGDHWVKIIPAEPLLFGEYCLVEILSDSQINLSVWDFGVHPTAPENRDVLYPEARRVGPLEHHPQD